MSWSTVLAEQMDIVLGCTFTLLSQGNIYKAQEVIVFQSTLHF